MVDGRFLGVTLSESCDVGPTGSSEDGMMGEGGRDEIVAIKVRE